MRRARRGRALRRRYGRMHQMQLPFNPVVRNVLGEERQIEKVWPDGSYNCPFCGSAASPSGCKNPACSAGEWALSNPEKTRHHYAEQRRQYEERQAEEKRRQEVREFSDRYREEQQHKHALKRAQVEGEARRRGACVHCALEPLPYRAPKYIKHRGTCPKERR
jgi:hypothetical protein